MFLRRRLPSCPTGATMIKSRGKVPAAKTSLLSEQKQRKHEDDELQKAAARGAAFEKCLSRKFASCVHRRRKEKLTRRKKISYIAVKGCPRIRVWLEIFFSFFVFVLLCFLFFLRGTSSTDRRVDTPIRQCCGPLSPSSAKHWLSSALVPECFPECRLLRCLRVVC